VPRRAASEAPSESVGPRRYGSETKKGPSGEEGPKSPDFRMLVEGLPDDG
jgi:hypothetical protein